MLPFTDADAARPDVAGGKGANLAILTRAGFPVPTGFILTTDAYRAVTADVAAELAETLDWARQQGTAGVAAVASRHMRTLVAGAPLPAAVAEALAHGITADETVAVRSSATVEDSPGAAFAGQFETILDVQGAEAAVAAVRMCWASLWSAGAVAGYIRSGMNRSTPAMAVVIQRQLAPDVAGVLFTAHPVTGRRDRVVVEAVPGRGDALVSGRAAPAHAEVSPDDPSGVPLLPPDAAAQLLELGQRVQEHFGCPQDIEWAMADGRIWLLQSRPITTLPLA